MNKAKERFDQAMFCFNKRQGTYLTHFYIFIKALYVVNAVLQFFMMNAFLSHDLGLYGYWVKTNILHIRPICAFKFFTSILLLLALSLVYIVRVKRFEG